VKRAQESSELRPELDARLVAELGVRRLTTGQKGRSEEGPRESFARHTDEAGIGNACGKQWSQQRQHGDLALDARDRDLPSREAERPGLLDDPDRVVPALTQRASGTGIELGELLREE
jgi:hypothetical protein